MSIRMRLTLWYSSILTATLLLSGIAAYFLISYNLIGNEKKNMEESASEVNSQMIVSSWNIDGTLQYQISLRRVSQLQFPGLTIQIIDNSGQIQYQTNGNILLPVPNSKEALSALKNQLYYYDKVTINGSPFLIYNKAIYISNDSSAQGQKVGLLQIGVKTENISIILRNFLYALAVFTIIIILVAASLGWFLARKALKPIEYVIETTDQIEKGADLARRIDYKGPADEIGKLTNTVNSMLARIQITYRELEDINRTQRRFVSDASHELRTPLTTIRGNVDLLEKMWRQIEQQPDVDPFANREKLVLSLEAMRDIASESARMSRLVNDLLSLARADSGFTIAKSPILLEAVVQEVIRKSQMLPRTAEWITGDLNLLNGITVNGDFDYLQQLLFIFVENALKYTPKGYVKLDALTAKDQVGIRIQDTGIGMNKDDVPLIFDRFYRADISRGQTAGTGLGLSIAQWIIDEFEGSIEVTTRTDQGSTFIIWLPVFGLLTDV